MLTKLKGINVDLTAFMPFDYYYPLCRFYTYFQWYVFIYFDQEKFCIFIQFLSV